MTKRPKLDDFDDNLCSPSGGFKDSTADQTALNQKPLSYL